MKILSHGGYWKGGGEKNTRIAFQRSFQLGYGVEADVRDHAGKLVVAHDVPGGCEMGFTEVLDMAESHASPERSLTLAINIKADGLAGLVAKHITKRSSLDCFAFDMSTPDMRAYLSRGVPVFTRMSDVEQQPVWLQECQGVWLDSFAVDPWYSPDLLSRLLAEKRVCVVSSELHGRDQHEYWQFLKPWSRHSGLFLCTDFPEDAHHFFNDSNET